MSQFYILNSVQRAQLIDATRVEDGRLVYIKRVGTGDLETEIVLKLTRESLRADPRNHCVPVLDVIQDDVDPSVSYLVMPYLRLMDDPAFENVEEAVDFVDQILDVRDITFTNIHALILLQGLVFIHEQGVAHRYVALLTDRTSLTSSTRDCSLKNLMMDATPLYPRGFHPVQSDYLPDVSSRAPHLSRAEAPVKYYFIDFGISVDIPVDVHPKLATGILGRDRDPPELSSDKPYDPFKLDVFILGNVFRKEFREVRP